MEPVNIIQGRAAPYRRDNVDTDEVVPARFLYRTRKDGFAETLFHDLRVDKNGEERSEFVLNQTAYRNPVVLVTGHNFGCGSSREHAVWALLDYGIRSVIAVSFGDIFRNNAIENGLLPVTIPDTDIEVLFATLEAGAPCELTLDLPKQEICGPGNGDVMFNFNFDACAKEALLEGRSGIDSTLALVGEIEAFENVYEVKNAWAFMR